MVTRVSDEIGIAGIVFVEENSDGPGEAE